MNIAVVLRQVPDLIEPLEVDASGAALDLGSASFVLNESDDHALEQALLLKESGGGSVTVVALDFGDVDNTLYAAAAKGADRIVKLSAGEGPLSLAAAAAVYAGAIKPLGAELVLVGVQAHDELEGVLPPLLAQALGLPYVGVIRGVKVDAGAATVWKEFPGAVMERLKVKLPAVLGIVGAEQPPRYVPVARIRAAMKATQFDEQDAAAPALEAKAVVGKLYPPASGSRAEILSGSESEVAAQLAKILVEKGLLK